MNPGGKKSRRSCRNDSWPVIALERRYDVLDYGVIGRGDYGSAKKRVCFDVSKGIMVDTTDIPETITNVAAKDRHSFVVTCDAQLYHLST